MASTADVAPVYLRLARDAQRRRDDKVEREQRGLRTNVKPGWLMDSEATPTELRAWADPTRSVTIGAPSSLLPKDSSVSSGTNEVNDMPEGPVGAEDTDAPQGQDNDEQSVTLSKYVDGMQCTRVGKNAYIVSYTQERLEQEERDRLKAAAAARQRQLQEAQERSERSAAAMAAKLESQKMDMSNTAVGNGKDDVQVIAGAATQLPAGKSQLQATPVSSGGGGGRNGDGDGDGDGGDDDGEEYSDDEEEYSDDDAW